ncbi:SPOR domain-containing protein [Helicobacter trogontum]|uniref:SPOR domain-containing protein n=1 Tax=Helicobacter trogontum TaxID=50960 RepID=A0A4U8SBB8_9HELI|nr:SPOR domain-containing protein [Helicobacter trogontum]TLD83339.1 SPOR domain-containing protein [Helicobacter trogontum]
MKDNNKPVNDIFQSDSGNKNKTKTLLLLTIVAIILISVFLIIAWVMTRDNPLQDMQNQNKGESTLNEPKSATLPYAHNLDSQNPLNLGTNKASLQLQEDESQINNPMSNVPPLGVPATNFASMSATDTKPSGNDDLENDARFQAAIRDLEKQHNDKKNTESKKLEPTKPDPLKQKEGVATKPKDSEKTDNKKQNDNIIPKPQNNMHPQAPSKDLEKQHNDKKNTESKKLEPTKPDPLKQKEGVSTKPKDSEKTDNKKQNDNIIPKPQNNVISANQGKAPEQGYYLQVGVFTQTPAQSFLNKIAKYNYRVLKTEEDGVAKSKYLIGPYISKNKAKEAEQKVREEVESKANVIFYQRQAK